MSTTKLKQMGTAISSSGTSDLHDQSPRWVVLETRSSDGKEERKIGPVPRDMSRVRAAENAVYLSSTPPDDEPKGSSFSKVSPNGDLPSPRQAVCDESGGSATPMALVPPKPLAPSRLSLSIPSLMGKSIKMGAGTIFPARLATYLSLPTNGTGFVNAIVAVATVAGVGEFTSFANLFGEFFVKSMTLRYQPQSRYQGPIGFVNTTLTQSAGQPILVASQHHGKAFPSTVATLAENLTVAHRSTYDPWVYTWVNIEKPATMTSPLASTAVNTQNWCLSDAVSAAAYTGAIQFLSQAVTGSVASAIVGQFLVTYEVLFRYRA